MIQKYLNSNKSWAVHKRAFSIWQHKPHQVAPLSETVHTCKSCGTEYQGNFCPRCGQSSCVGRFSFKTVFTLFLDIWGIGNRGMFRSLRDLILRPGYMIRDYVGGCQSAYFPPFKMFFILATFSLLLSHGFDLNTPEKHVYIEGDIPNEVTLNGEKIDNEWTHYAQTVPKTMVALEERNPTIFSFLMLVLISSPLYLFFRHCPNVPDLRYSEHLVALVYTSNMYSLYSLLAQLVPSGISHILKLTAFFMIFVALKQFTGYSKRRLLGYMILSFILFLVVLLAVAALVIGAYYFIYGEK